MTPSIIAVALIVMVCSIVGIATPSAKQAMEDFSAVKKGLAPIYAKFDVNAGLPADGGTTYYVGHGYRLTVLKRLARVHGVDGYFYGPIISIGTYADNGYQGISSIKFYSRETLP